jgi:hypothetical protein
MNKRLITGLITGSILGVVCIVGASLRSTEALPTLYLFSFWFNRVIMGLVFGLLPVCVNPYKKTIRGIILGLFVSFAFYSATEFQDLMGFLAGGMYGIILAWVITYIDKRQFVKS